MIDLSQDNNVPAMTTQYIVYRSLSDLEVPAQLLARGEVVAFPTETVYGLGACATNVSAIRKIYAAKGRPQDNPLIVHVADARDIRPLVKTISPLAQCLIDAFMPGPITLVMPKSDIIPNEVSAELNTVGIRIPANPVARALIEKAGLPVAAPSANISGRPSPTLAEHVFQDMNGRIACILDAGPCEVGLESTVVDVTGQQPQILRPGSITFEMIHDACNKCGIIFNNSSVEVDIENTKSPKSPGIKYRHYAPGARVKIVHYENEDSYIDALDRLFIRLSICLEDKKMGVFCAKKTQKRIIKDIHPEILKKMVFYCYDESESVCKAAQRLFAAFRTLDNMGVSYIVAPGFEKKGQGIAYMNRLEKASETNPLESNSEDCNVSRKVLFVCTGNTCRSPMAEAILRHIVRREGPYHLIEDNQCSVEIIVSSAGVFATHGEPAALNAQKTLESVFEESLSDHLSRSSDEKIIAENDIVLAVTEEHAHILRTNFPGHSKKIFSLKEYAKKHKIFSKDQDSHTNIPDPYGRDLSVYEQTATALYGIMEMIFPFLLAYLGVQKNNK